MEGTTSFAEIYALALDISVDDLKTAIDNSSEFKQEVTQAFQGQENDFEGAYKRQIHK